MTITFRTNIAALRAQRQLALSGSRLLQTFERLSSGSRINRPSDDAAGLAVSSQLQANARIYNQGVRNINDGISALNIAEGTTTQLTDVLHRLRELSIQAANGVLGLTQRRSLDDEAYALTNEYNRLIGSTRFNGLNLLNGSLSQLQIQAGVGSDESLGFGIGQQLQRNKGVGSFSVSFSSTTASLSGNVESGDLDGDGDLDLAVASGDGNVYTYLNDGAGNFTDDQIINSSSVEMKLADWNGDGKMDIITADIIGTSQIQVWRRNATTGVYNATTLNTGFTNFQEVQIATGDVNNDGFTDMIIGAATDDLTKVILNGGQRNFNSANFTFLASESQNISGSSSSYRELTLADLNSDGTVDLIDSFGSDVEVRYGNGDGSFRATSTVTVAGNAQSVSFGDINHDGLTDMFVGSSLGPYVLQQTTGGSWQSTTIGNGLSSTIATRMVDLNTDGNLDLLFVRGSANEIWYGSDTGTFTQGASLSGTAAQDFGLGDFNADGVTDIVNRYTGNFAVNIQNTQTTANIQRLNLTTKQAALDSLSIIDAALARVSSETGAIGSIQSRLGIALNNLQSRKDEYLGASARITDIDVAKESADMVRLNILQQTASAVAGQANVAPQIGLDLLTSATRSNRLF